MASSLKCSRLFSFVAAVLTIIMGLVGLIIGAWMLGSGTYKELFKYQITVISAIMLTVSIIMILNGILGIYAAKSSSNNLLTFFWGLLVLCAFFYMIVGVLGSTLPGRIRTDGCGSKYYTQIGVMNETSTLAMRRLCQSTDNCTCYMNVTQIGGDTFGLVVNANNPSLPTRVQDCPNRTSTSYDDVMRQIQQQFSCSGWCDGTMGYIYTFKNLNSGRPQRSCFSALINWFQTFCRIAAIPAYIFAGAIIILLALVWWNLCEIVDLQTATILQVTGKTGPTAVINNTYEVTNIPVQQQIIQIPQNPNISYTYQSNPSGINSLAELNNQKSYVYY